MKEIRKGVVKCIRQNCQVCILVTNWVDEFWQVRTGIIENMKLDQVLVWCVVMVHSCTRFWPAGVAQTKCFRMPKQKTQKNDEREENNILYTYKLHGQTRVMQGFGNP